MNKHTAINIETSGRIKKRDAKGRTHMNTPQNQARNDFRAALLAARSFIPEIIAGATYAYRRGTGQGSWIEDERMATEADVRAVADAIKCGLYSKWQRPGFRVAPAKSRA